MLQQKRKINHEHKEQVKVVRFLEQQKVWNRVLLFTAMVRETYTGSFYQNNYNKAAGVREGLPDLFILLPEWQVWIEMKRPRRILLDGSIGESPSKSSLAQVEWVTTLNQYPKTKALICYGADEAIRFLTSLIGNVQAPTQTDEERNKGLAEFHSFISR